MKLEENNQAKKYLGESLLGVAAGDLLLLLLLVDGVVGGEVAQLGLVLVLAHQVQLARVAVLLLE